MHITKSVDFIENDTLTDFVETKQWSDRNKLPINYNKTTCMSAGTRKRLADSCKLEIKVDDICIHYVSKHTLLDIYIDENLNWSAHIIFVQIFHLKYHF